jgi:hypothetical protein
MHTSHTNAKVAASALLGAAAFMLGIAAYADPPSPNSAPNAGRDEGAHHGGTDRPELRDHPDHPNRPDHPDRPQGSESGDPGLHLGREREIPEHGPAWMAARHALEKQIAEAIHKDKKEVTVEERDLIRMQWRRHARLWRIREIAEAAKDTAVVQKCDQLLAKSDDWLVKRLQDLNSKAVADSNGKAGDPGPKSGDPGAKTADSNAKTAGGTK